jgi:hypothetical protein
VGALQALTFDDSSKRIKPLARFDRIAIVIVGGKGLIG